MSAFDVSQISALSDVELVKLLTANGLPSGPITGTTRMVFENLLRSRLTNAIGNCDKKDGDEDEQVSMGKEQSCNSRQGKGEVISQDKCSRLTDSENGIFYGVCCAGLETTSDGCELRQFEPLVFNSQQLALEAVKNRKGSRFKAFKRRSDAESFSLSETPTSEPSHKDVIKQKLGSEPVSIFKTPSPREIINFRRSIENETVDNVRNLVFSNPKYMVSSGETPVVLQEGSRYNAMHIAVRAKRLDICELIVNILSEDKFWNLLFPETSDASCELLRIRKQRMIDLYLNTPDKVACESPLHMASKYGLVEIVGYLKSFSSLVIDNTNSYGETPKDVIGSRYTGINKDEVDEQIFNILEGRSYIPVFRSEDGSCLPYIGKPIAQEAMPSASTKELSSGAQSPIEGNHVVKAYAGPMSPKKANFLYEKWLRSPKEKEWATVTREDFDKGLERIGRKLTNDGDIPWTEYWSFLGSFENLSTISGLERLERHLQRREDSIRSHIIQIYSTPQRYQKSKMMRRAYSPAIARIQQSEISPVRRQVDETSSNFKPLVKEMQNPNDDVKKKLFIDQTDNQTNMPLPDQEEAVKESRTDLKLRLVRQEACCDGKNTSLNRLKLGNLRSLSAGDAEVKSQCYQEGIPLKYSFDLEESFQNLSLETSQSSNSDKSPQTGTIQRSHGAYLPPRAYSDVGNLQTRNRDGQGFFREQSSTPLSQRVYSPTRHPTKVETIPCTPPKAPNISPQLTSVLTPDTAVDDVNDIPLPLFIEGLQPTKTDLDVLRAIDGAEIDSSQFPSVWKWIRLVRSYSWENQQSWPSPGSPRYRSRVFERSPIWSC